MHGYCIEATDGHLGSVADLLFDDQSWIIRWLVVDTGNWLPGRQVLLPVSALGIPDVGARAMPVRLTMQQVRDAPGARDLLSVRDHMVRYSDWRLGGDGWAHDIGFGRLEHVAAAGRDVNVLVLDMGVYSNSGGRASKAMPLGAVGKAAAAGKRTARKDLALQAIAYGNVDVAQVAMDANPQRRLLTMREAEALATRDGGRFPAAAAMQAA